VAEGNVFIVVSSILGRLMLGGVPVLANDGPGGLNVKPSGVGAGGLLAT